MLNDYPEIYHVFSKLSLEERQACINEKTAQIKSQNEHQRHFFEILQTQIAQDLLPDSIQLKAIEQKIYTQAKKSGDTFRYLLRDCKKKLYDYVFEIGQTSALYKCRQLLDRAQFLIERGLPEIAKEYWQEGYHIAKENNLYEEYPRIYKLEIQAEFQTSGMETCIAAFAEIAFKIAEFQKYNQHLALEKLDENNHELYDLFWEKKKAVEKKKADESIYQTLGVFLTQHICFHEFPLDRLNFEYSFTGYINESYPIFMKLKSVNGSISGYYSYSKVGGILKLNGQINEKGNIELKERNESGTLTGEFSGKMYSNKIEGKWRKPLEEPLPFLIFQFTEHPEILNNQSFYKNWFYHLLLYFGKSSITDEDIYLKIEAQIQERKTSLRNIETSVWEMFQRMNMLQHAFKAGNKTFCDKQIEKMKYILYEYKNHPALINTLGLFLENHSLKPSTENSPEVFGAMLSGFTERQIRDSAIRLEMNMLILFLYNKDLKQAQRTVNSLNNSPIILQNEITRIDLALVAFALAVSGFEKNLDMNNEKNKLRKLLKGHSTESPKKLFEWLNNKTLPKKSESLITIIDNPLHTAIIELLND